MRGFCAVRQYRSLFGRARGGLAKSPTRLVSVLGSSPGPSARASASRTGPGPVPRGRAEAKPRRGALRREALARQRQVVGALVVTLVLCVVLAVATGATAAWWAVVALLPLTCAYMAVLARSRRISAEREISYAFFGDAGQEHLPPGGFEELFAAKSDRAAASR
ncbi:MAG: hypothetical protein ACP5VR_08030 [Acidimicrobiales bacterium]